MPSPVGRHGVKRSLSTSRRKPSSDSVMSRYIQPAEPVYQVQPPRPVCGGDGVDVGGDDVRLDLVEGDRFGRVAVGDGVDQREELPGAFGVAHARRRP